MRHMGNSTLPPCRLRPASTPSRHCYLYRFYEPNLQRWINQDPIVERGGYNLYQFAVNSPLTFIDSDGEGVIAPIIAIVLVVWSHFAPDLKPEPVFVIEWSEPPTDDEKREWELQAAFQRMYPKDKPEPLLPVPNPLPLPPYEPEDTGGTGAHGQPHTHEPQITIPPRPPQVRCPIPPNRPPYVRPSPPTRPPRDKWFYRGGPSRGRANMVPAEATGSPWTLRNPANV